MHQKPTLSVVIPCFSPVESWEINLLNSLNELKSTLPNEYIELVLVDDGSGGSINSHSITYLQNNISHFRYESYQTNKGKGHALRVGVKLAAAKYIVFTDVDFPYLNQSIISVFSQLKLGSNVVLGVREKKYYDKVPYFRKLISKGLRFLLKNILKLPVTDTQCGLKGFDENGKTIFLQTSINRFLFDLEFIILAAKIPEIKLNSINAELKDGVVFSKVKLSILVGELGNLLKLLLK